MADTRNSKKSQNSNTKKRNAANTIIISALAYLVLGIIMVIFPQNIKDFFGIALGISLTVYGIFNIISFFRDKDSGLYLELIVGVLATAFGIFSFISPLMVANMMMIVIGVLIVIDSLMDIKHSFALKSLGAKYWWIYTVLSVAVIILGLCTIFFPNFFGSALIILLGIILIYEGISSLVVMLMIGHYAKNLPSKAEMIETNATDNY